MSAEKAEMMSEPYAARVRRGVSGRVSIWEGWRRARVEYWNAGGAAGAGRLGLGVVR